MIISSNTGPDYLSFTLCINCELFQLIKWKVLTEFLQCDQCCDSFYRTGAFKLFKLRSAVNTHISTEGKFLETKHSFLSVKYSVAVFAFYSIGLFFIIQNAH